MHSRVAAFAVVYMAGWYATFDKQPAMQTSVTTSRICTRAHGNYHCDVLNSATNLAVAIATMR